MKFGKFFFCFLAVSLAVLGCSKPAAEEDTKPASISLEQTSIDFPADGGSLDIVLVASHAWTAQTDSWITLSPNSGDGSVTYNFVTVKAEKNTGTASRTGTVTFTLTGKGKTASVTVNQKGAETVMTIAEFKKQSVPASTATGEWYALKGQITSIEGYSYGNFYLKDDTGEILVYGLTQTQVSSNDQSFSKLNLKAGDIVTLKTQRSEYRGVAQAGGTPPAYYVSHTEGTAPEAPFKDFVASSTNAGWMELPATSASDEYKFIFHGMRIGSVAQRGYSLYYDTTNHDAIWAAYPLNRTLMGYGKRTDIWGNDPLLEDKEQAVVKTSAFYGGYSRGHQVPSADRTGYEINLRTFYGTNMTPQNSTFNEGFWATLEEQVRTWAKSASVDTMYVVTGCVLKGSTAYATDNDGKKVTVPVAYYKALLRLSNGSYSACAFYYDHSASLTGKYNDAKYMISIDALEEKTGVDYFVNLPSRIGADQAAKIEAATPDTSSWN